LWARLKFITKAVERTAEVISQDILARQQQEIRRAKQLELPVGAGPRIPILCIQIDGTGLPLLVAETQGRQGKTQPTRAHARSKTRLSLHPDHPPYEKPSRLAKTLDHGGTSATMSRTP
jgi:hypothetical protein